MRIPTILAAAAAVAVAGACTDTKRAAAPTATPPGIARPTTPAASPSPTAPTTDIRYAFGATLRTEIGDAQRAKAVPEERAVAESRKVDTAHAGLARTAELGVLDDVQVEADDGSTLDGRLVWVVTIRDAPTRNGACDVSVILDAGTAEGLALFETCA